MRSVNVAGLSVVTSFKHRNHVRESHDPILDKERTDDLRDHIRSGVARRRAAFSHEWPPAVSGQSHPNPT
jgi:hypothetical protein